MIEKYEFIESQKTDEKKYAYPVEFMCRLVAVSKSGFYEWRSRPESATAERREYLKVLVRKAFEDSDETYGYRRVHAQLARWGVEAGPELVRSVMRGLDLVACQPRPWRHSLTESGAGGPIPDLVHRDFTADAPGVKMVGDITYITQLGKDGSIWQQSLIVTRRLSSVGRWMTTTRRPSFPPPSRWRLALK